MPDCLRALHTPIDSLVGGWFARCERIDAFREVAAEASVFHPVSVAAARNLPAPS